MVEVKKFVNESPNVYAQTGKRPRDLYRKSFNDLSDETTYHDPLGMRTGKSFTAKDKFFEADREQIEMFNRYQKNGFSVEDSVYEVRKAVDSGSWDLPVYYLPDVSLVNPEITPLADMIPRQTVSQETVNVTSILESNEPDVKTDIESQSADYVESNVTFTEHNYDVDSYSIMLGVSDKMILASQDNRQPLSVAEDVGMETIRKFEEFQMINGSDIWSGASLTDNATTEVTTDATNTTKENVRDLISKTRQSGCSLSDMAIVMDFEAYDSLKGDLTDVEKYDLIDTNEFDYGYRSLKFDSVPVLPSTGFDSITTGDAHTIAFNMSRTFLGMLQDTVVRPLGRTGPQEKIALDTYGAFVSERPEQVYSIDQT